MPSAASAAAGDCALQIFFSRFSRLIYYAAGQTLFASRLPQAEVALRAQPQAFDAAFAGVSRLSFYSPGDVAADRLPPTSFRSMPPI